MAKILLVEDEKSTVVMLTQALTKAGHTVVSAGNGKDGIAKARSESPDLVIMDMGLPKVNGWEATRALKADAATAKVPVLALTSATTSEDRDEAYNVGCDAYATKPVDVPSLLARVKELVGA